MAGLGSPALEGLARESLDLELDVVLGDLFGGLRSLVGRGVLALLGQVDDAAVVGGEARCFSRA